MRSNKKIWFLISVIFLSIFCVNVIYAFVEYPAQDLEYYDITASGGEEEIIVHGECRKITNTASKEAFVPTKTAVEWSLFINNAPSEITIRNPFSCRKLCEDQGGEIKAFVNLDGYKIYCKDNALDSKMASGEWDLLTSAASGSANSGWRAGWPPGASAAHCLTGTTDWRCENVRYNTPSVSCPNTCASGGGLDAKCIYDLTFKYRGQDYNTKTQSCCSHYGGDYACRLPREPWTCEEWEMPQCQGSAQYSCDVCNPPNCVLVESCSAMCGCGIA
jgi:hypothetical protein